MKPVRAAPLALTAACVGILAWRVPLIHRSGTHRDEAAVLLGHPLPASLVAARDRQQIRAGDAIVYVYAESCPYCGMDRARVRRASVDGGGSAPFQAVRLGQIGAPESYWRQTHAPMPDRLMSVSWHLADSLGIEGVPLLIVSHRGRVTAAWLGHLAWGEADITRALRCRLGNAVSCAVLYAADVVRGFGGASADATVTVEAPDTLARPALP